MNSNFTIVELDENARSELLAGVNILTDAVQVTMGPKGQNVVIEQKGVHPIVTKDGVTVAKAINLRDQFKNLGVQMARESASRTAEEAGDGTTTATVLTRSIFSKGLKLSAAGHKSIDVKRGIDYAATLILEKLDDMSKPISSPDEMLQIATISANGEKDIAALICDAIQAVGEDGTVTVEDAKGFKSSLSVVEGSRIDRGFLSPYFINNHEKMISELDNPFILVCNRKLESLKEIIPSLEIAAQANRPLLLVADDIDGEALHGLVLNVSRGALKACAIRSPAFGDQRVSMLDDLSALCGATVFSNVSEATLEDVKVSDFGECKKAIIGKSTTVLVSSKGDQEKIDKRIYEIKSALREKSIDESDLISLKTRLSRLTGGVAILRVGGATEAELIERKDRVDDALSATHAAIQSGILPGGGTSLVKVSKQISLNTIPDRFREGSKLLLDACSEPMSQIIKNAGGPSELIIEKVSSKKDYEYGYDVANEKFGNLIDMGIIDPLKVVKCAVENASSAAGMMLTVGCAMIDDLEKTD
jgi:chaperonin GroEL